MSLNIKFPLAIHTDGVVLSVRVTPNAKKDAVENIKLDVNGKAKLRVRVTAVPEDGKANKAVIKLLAKYFAISSSSFTLISGDTSRHKRFLITAPYEMPKFYEMLCSCLIPYV